MPRELLGCMAVTSLVLGTLHTVFHRATPAHSPTSSAQCPLSSTFSPGLVTSTEDICISVKEVRKQDHVALGMLTGRPLCFPPPPPAPSSPEPLGAGNKRPCPSWPLLALEKINETRPNRTWVWYSRIKGVGSFMSSSSQVCAAQLERGLNTSQSYEPC